MSPLRIPFDAWLRDRRQEADAVERPSLSRNIGALTAQIRGLQAQLDAVYAAHQGCTEATCTTIAAIEQAHR